jgi:hypothetical protein
MNKNPDENTLYGYALYFEVKTPSGMHHQILLTPPVRVFSENEVPRTVIFRRALGPHNVRKHWRITTGSSASGVETSTALDHVTRIVGRLATLNGEAVHQPLVVEVSVADVAGIKNGRTPYKVLGRVERVKKALGLPGMPGKS